MNRIYSSTMWVITTKLKYPSSISSVASPSNPGLMPTRCKSVYFYIDSGLNRVSIRFLIKTEPNPISTVIYKIIQWVSWWILKPYKPVRSIFRFKVAGLNSTFITAIRSTGEISLTYFQLYRQQTSRRRDTEIMCATQASHFFLSQTLQ